MQHNEINKILQAHRKVTNLLSSCFLITCLAFNQGHLYMFSVTAGGLRKLLLAYWHAVGRGHPGMPPSTLQSKEWTCNKRSLGIQRWRCWGWEAQDSVTSLRNAATANRSLCLLIVGVKLTLFLLSENKHYHMHPQSPFIPSNSFHILSASH